MLVKQVYRGTIEFIIEEGKEPDCVIKFKELPFEHTESMLNALNKSLLKGYRALGVIELFRPTR